VTRQRTNPSIQQSCQLSAMNLQWHQALRLLVKKLMINIINTKNVNGNFKGKDVLLPRIPAMIPKDMLFEFKLCNFRYVFAMTVKKNLRTFTTSLWTEFRRSMLLTCTTICDLPTRRINF